MVQLKDNIVKVFTLQFYLLSTEQRTEEWKESIPDSEGLGGSAHGDEAAGWGGGRGGCSCLQHTVAEKQVERKQKQPGEASPLRAGTEGGPGGPAERQAGRQAGLRVRGRVLAGRPSDSPLPASRHRGPVATVTPPVVPEVSCCLAR